jgi:rhamnogalacturonan endolyase
MVPEGLQALCFFHDKLGDDMRFGFRGALALLGVAWSTFAMAATGSINLTAKGSSTAVVLTWTATDLTTATQEVYRNTTSDATGRGRIAVASTSARTYSDATAVAGTKYYYWIKNTTSGVVTNSNAASGQLKSSSSSSSSSSAVSGSISLTATGAVGGVVLSWSVSNLTTSTQQIYRGADSTFANSSLIGTAASTARTYTDSTGVAGIKYIYWVKNTTSGTVTTSNGASGKVRAASSSSSSSSASSKASSASSVSSSSKASSASSSSSSKASSSAVSSSSSKSSVASSSGSSASSGRYVEKLGRGVVAVPASGGMLVSWRLLGTDPSSIGFNVYRNGSKLNSSVITASTNYNDTAGTSSSTYTVVPVISGVEQTGSGATVLANPYLKIAISQPAGGTTPDGVAYTYDANDGTVADLDGDGEYEIILKWQPTNAKDNSQSGYTGPTIVDAYKLNGTRLWRINLGKNIRAGAHYTSIVAYDLDSDGKAEVMMKTADGTVDGAGTVIGSSTVDYRNSKGYILTGPEYLTVFNGKTGAAMASTNYLPARGTVSSWGDSYGNRVDRFLASVAYLDGTRPSAVFSRGYYTRAVIVAWDWRDGKLTNRWTYDSGSKAGVGAYNQGAHWFSVADVNHDGKDDIIYGAATINSDGTMLYSTGLGHGDALHVGVLNPNRTGEQVFMVHEEPASYGQNAMEMHDAATGQILWSYYGSGGDIGRGVCADIDPAFPGEECWSTAGDVLMSSSGVTISSTKRPSPVNFAVWWDGDLSRELLDGTKIDKWVPSSLSTTRLLSAYNYGADSNNSTKATPVISADIFGDWREEVVWRTSDNTALLVFTTPYPTTYRIPTLMHDPQYRVQVAGQNMGYNQPPHPSFFLGNGMGAVSLPAIRTP